MFAANWLTYALSIQLALSFFMPPVPVGGRLLFAADLWAMLWVGSFATLTIYRSAPMERSRFLRAVTGIFVFFSIVFLHGWHRESLAPALRRFIDAPEDDLFSVGREGVIAVRFITWSVGGILVARRAVDVERIEKSLNVCVVGAVAATILSAFSPFFRSGLGTLFRYDPNVPNWADRAFGTFQSPIEACAAYSLALLFVALERGPRKTVKIALIGSLVIGIILTKTLTAFIAAIAALIYAGLTIMPARRRRLAITAAFLATVTLVAALWQTAFFAGKRANLVFRIKPWEVYWKTGLASPDRFLLGNGFIPHFSDNIWIFFFSRGGLFWLMIALGLLLAGWRKFRDRLSPLQKAVPVFFLVAGMTVDIAILRPIVYLMLAAGIPLLKPRPSS